MNICLDVRGNYFGGVLTYSYSVLKAFSELATDHKFFVLLDNYQHQENLFAIDGMEKIIVPQMTPLRILIWNNLKLPQLLTKNRIDVYHGFKHFTLRGKGTKLIFSLRSASWWLYPSLFKKNELFFWRLYYALGAKMTDLILTTSEADKKIFVAKHKISSDKVVAIHQAPDSRFSKITDSERLNRAKKRYSLPEKYILFVGTIYPFKNIETVIQAYAFAKKERKLSHKLVLVGGISPAFGARYQGALEKIARECNVHDDIVWTGAVFKELPEIYSMADIFVFPSLYESYTKPPIEAMACEVPTIVSDEGGLPEVVGSAARIHKYNDVESIASSMLEILSSHELRQSLIEKGYRRAKTFSWQRCAMETIAVYEKIFHS